MWPRKHVNRPFLLQLWRTETGKIPQSEVRHCSGISRLRGCLMAFREETMAADNVFVCGDSVEVE